MTEPTSKEEYLRRFAANTAYEGTGLDTTAVFPCPFCAAARWMAARVLDVEAIMKKPHHCGECGRSAQTIFTYLPGGGKRFEVVQTAGPDQPDWLEPKMRRV